jgi:hypothetical protein
MNPHCQKGVLVAIGVFSMFLAATLLVAGIATGCLLAAANAMSPGIPKQRAESQWLRDPSPLPTDTSWPLLHVQEPEGDAYHVDPPIAQFDTVSQAIVWDE